MQHNHESFEDNNSSCCLPGPSRENPFFGQEVMCFRFLAAESMVFIWSKERIFERGRRTMAEHTKKMYIQWFV